MDSIRAGGVAERCGAKVFLAGVELPGVVSVSVSASVGGPAEATVEIPYLDAATRIAPMTPIHIFYDSHEHWSDPSLPGSNDGRWRLLFCGEVHSWDANHSGAGAHAFTLIAQDFSGVMRRAYLFSLTYGAGEGGPTVIANRSAFFGTYGNPFGDTVNDPGTMVKRLMELRQEGAFPSIYNPKGPLGNLMAIVEMALGIQGHSRGVNDYFTVWERRFRFLEQVGTDDGASAQSLFASTAFQNWLTQRVASLGSVVSLSDVMNLILSYTFSNHIPCPVAVYRRGRRDIAPLRSTPAPLTTAPAAGSAPPAAPAEYRPAAGRGWVGIGGQKSAAEMVGMNQVFLEWLQALVAQLNAMGVLGVEIADGKRKLPSSGVSASTHVIGVAADLTNEGGTGFNSRTHGRPHWAGSDMSGAANAGPYAKAIWGYWQYPSAQSLADLVGKPLHADLSVPDNATMLVDLMKNGRYSRVLLRHAVGKGPELAKFTEKDRGVLERNAGFYAKIGEALRINPKLGGALDWLGKPGYGFQNLYSGTPNMEEEIVWKRLGLGCDPVHVQFKARSNAAVSPTDAGKRVYLPAPGTAPAPVVPGGSGTPPAPVAPVAVATTPPTVGAAGTPGVRSSATPPAYSDPSEERQRLITTLYLPDCFFCPPPLSNLIFPEELVSFSMTRGMGQEVSRVELEAQDGIIQQGNSSININSVYYAPQLVETRRPDGKAVESLQGVGFQTAVMGSNGTPLIMPHERHAGIIPRQVGITNIAFSLTPDDVLPSDPTSPEAQALYGRMAGEVAEWMLLESRYAARRGGGSCKFLPRLVPGLPACVFLRPAVAGLRTDAPTHWVGTLASVTHTLHQGGAATSFSMSHLRSHRMQSAPDDLFMEGRYALREQFGESGGVIGRSIEVRDAKLTQGDVAFLHRVRELAFPDFVRITAAYAAPAGSALGTAASGSAANTTPFVVPVPAGMLGPSGKPVRTITVHPLNAQERAIAKSNQIAASSAANPVPLGPSTTSGYEDTPLLLLQGELEPLKVYWLGYYQGAAEEVWVATTSGSYYSEEDMAEDGSPSGAPAASPPATRAVRNAVAPFPFAKVEVEEVGGGVREPIEETLRPPWMGEDYRNDNIGSHIYEPLIGVGSVIDYVKNRPVPADYTVHHMEEALDAILRDYTAVSRGGFAAPAWIRSLTWRPTATLGQVLSSETEGPVGSRTPIPGFHYHAVRGKGLEDLDLKGYVHLKNPWTWEALQQVVDPALDVREESQQRVSYYRSLLLASPGIRG